LGKLAGLVRRALPLRVRQAIRTGLVPDSSQDGEGAVLEKLMAGLACEEWVIDVGANDGVVISNSLPFIERGWRGIMIEPAPAVYKKLIANHGHRKNVTCLQIACCDKAGEADLYIGSDGEEGFMSTLCTLENGWFDFARSSTLVKVQTDTLTNVLKQHHAPARPGLLLVDCEGMDYEVLLGLDFEQFRPAVIVTEEFEIEPEKQVGKYSLLIRANYGLVHKIGCNTIWRDHSAAKRV